MTSDPRYGSRRWKVLRLRVLARDRSQCQVIADCPRKGNHCDHIDPVDERTTDAEFYNMARLRAACMFHNTRRGHVAAFEREQGGVMPLCAPRGTVAFFRGQRGVQRPLANLYTQGRGSSRRAVVGGDYSRKVPA